MAEQILIEIPWNAHKRSTNAVTFWIPWSLEKKEKLESGDVTNPKNLIKSKPANKPQNFQINFYNETFWVPFYDVIKPRETLPCTFYPHEKEREISGEWNDCEYHL